MKHAALHNLNAYERPIAESLMEGWRYSEQEAVFIVRGYASVMERIGWFENPREWAVKLDEAMRCHITPDMWHTVL